MVEKKTLSFAPLIGHSRHNYRKIVGVCCRNFLAFLSPTNNSWLLTQFIYAFGFYAVGFSRKSFPYFPFNFIVFQFSQKSFRFFCLIFCDFVLLLFEVYQNKVCTCR